MKPLGWFAKALAVGLWLLGCSPAWAQCAVPNQPEPLAVEMALPGIPPLIQVPDYYSTGAERYQFEIRKSDGRLFARKWAKLNWRDKTVWQTEEGGIYLRGAGPSGFRLFPAGTYRVKWRGWNKCGLGQWSTETEFSVAAVNDLSINFTEYPSRIGPADDLAFAWTNRFAAGRYKMEIRNSSKIVRKQTFPGWFYIAKGTFPPYWVYDHRLFGESYFDRPSKPEKELPDATGYVFRVSAYSPNVKKWSPWAEAPFHIERGIPVLPTLSCSQQDYRGYFTQSPRPYFSADYGERTAALWTYVEIRQKVGDKLKLIAKEWFSRYDNWGWYNQAQFSIGGGAWKKDLPPGEYVWRVQAWNSAAQTTWTPIQTSAVVAAGALAKPSAPSEFNYWAGAKTLYWTPVPNAYRYEVQIFKNGSPFRKSPVLDVAKGTASSRFEIYNDGENADWWSKGKLPAGRYTFKVRALSGAQVSDWSASSQAFVVE